MKRLVPILLMLVLAGAGAWWWGQRDSAAEPELAASGTIEARQVRLAAEVGGRIVELSAEEGQAVQAGQALLRLDDSLLQAQRAQAEAAIATARAQRNVLAAKARPEQIQAARAAISTTQAAVAGAQADLSRLLAGASSADIAAAEAAVVQAQAQQLAAKQAHDQTMQCHDVTLPNGKQKEICPALGTIEEKARSNLQAADEAVRAAQARLKKVYQGATRDEINAAKARVAQAEAQVKQAQAQYDLLLAGASQEQLAAADAAVLQAQAALKVLDAQAAKLAVYAPVDGVVIARNVEPGEILSPGAIAYVIGRLDELELTVYLPEDRYGQVKVGQAAWVSVDSYPGETFEGEVVYIADQAEFTPRNVQTAEGRRTMVFAVKLSLPNPAGKLKPGMPADVKFEG